MRDGEQPKIGHRYFVAHVAQISRGNAQANAVNSTDLAWSGLVRDQEVGGSNPLAPTTLFRISYLHHGKNLKSAWSMGKKVSGSNPLAPTVPFNHLRCFVLLQVGSIWVQHRIEESPFRRYSLAKFGTDVRATGCCPQAGIHKPWRMVLGKREMEERCLRNCSRKGLSALDAWERAGVSASGAHRGPLAEPLSENHLARTAQERILAATGKPKWKSLLTGEW